MSQRIPPCCFCKILWCFIDWFVLFFVLSSRFFSSFSLASENPKCIQSERYTKRWVLAVHKFTCFEFGVTKSKLAPWAIHHSSTTSSWESSWADRNAFSPSDTPEYGVATSRLFQILGLFCKRAPLKRWYSAKETYNFKEPTNRSHPIIESLFDKWIFRYMHITNMIYTTWYSF